MRTGTVGRLFDAGPNNFNVLRLLAALAVIYGHAFPIVGSGGQDLYLALVGNKFIGGVAVDVFFVISGFLIAASLERSSPARYAWSRALRIFPALIVALLLSVFVLGPVLTTSEAYWTDAQTWRYLYNNALMVRTEYFLPGVFDGHPDRAINGSLWSLPVEFRLYVLFFMLSILGLLKAERYMLLTIALWLLALAVMPRYPVFEQYDTWVNAAALFFAGALVWTRRYEVPLSPWGVLAVIAIGVMTHGTPAFKTLYVVGLVYVVFVSALSIRLPRVESRDLSYGVYLYGWPAQQLAFHLVPGPHPYVNALLGATIALCIAWASWEFVERPALSFKSLVR